MNIPKRSETESSSGLTTRIPAGLRTQVKLYCLEHDLEMRKFIEDALREKLQPLKGGSDVS